APFEDLEWEDRIGVHIRDSDVAADAALAPGVVVGASQIDSGSLLGPNVVVESARIGAGCRIDAGAVVGPNVTLGDHVHVGANSVIGAPGFGYQTRDGAMERLPHIGGVVIDDDVHIGAGCCIDAGTLEPTRIGRGSRLDNLVHVAHNVRIGQRCVIL